VKHCTHFEFLVPILPNDLDQRLRKFDNVRKNDLSLELGISDAARKDESYQTDASFDAR
jgi:hypothetical protein